MRRVIRSKLLVVALVALAPAATHAIDDPCYIKDPTTGVVHYQGDLPPAECEKKAAELAPGPICWPCAVHWTNPGEWYCHGDGTTCLCCYIEVPG